VRGVFEEHATDKLSSAALVEALADIEEAPWGEWRGKPITVHGVARLLKRFEIRPRTIRLEDATPKGYHREQFEDIWARYLPTPPIRTAITPQPASLSENPTEANRNRNPFVAVPESTATPHGSWDVAAVAVQKGGTGPLCLLCEQPYVPDNPCSLRCRDCRERSAA
jgi:hypothetical protein